MDFSVAFIKNEKQMILHHVTKLSDDTKDFNNEKLPLPQIVNFEEIKEEKIDAIFIPEELLKNDFIMERMEEESKFTPIKVVKNHELSADQFESLTKEEIILSVKKVNASWSLQNNLSLLENLFENCRHLKSLWPNERTAFFEELWHLLKNNLGARDLKIAYNDLYKSKKENEKKKLLRVVIEGKKAPTPTENKELGEALFKNYQGHFSQNFNLYSHNRETGETVILASIHSGPVIIMAKTDGPTKLQLSLLKTLFDALSLGSPLN